MDSNQDLSPEERNDFTLEPVPRTSYKSFRRKYRKIMVTFEDRMRESNTLFREHQRIVDISRRLSEQNDQLLELLYDLNQSPQVASSHRYDLRPPTLQNAGFSSPINAGSAALHDARQGLSNGKVSMTVYRRMGDNLRLSKDSQPLRSYAWLVEKPYSTPDIGKTQDEATDTVLDGFPTPREEERYLEDLDSYLNGNAPAPRPSSAARGGERSSEKEREMALKNPVSVYNWLRKHQPQVFLQDNEAHSEKPTTRPAARASKRASTVKQETDLYDEDGIAIDAGPSAKGKRKRDDDGGYRPKGGNGRSVRRKKEDGSVSAKKSKRDPLT